MNNCNTVTSNKKRRMTEQEKEIIRRMRLEGYGCKRIAKQIGRSSGTVGRWIKRLGLPTNLKDSSIEQKRVAVTKLIRCKHCHKEHNAHRYHAKFCSDKCRVTYNKQYKGNRSIQCRWCGETFKTYNRSYCTDQCRYDYERYAAKAREENKRVTTKEHNCLHCCNIFTGRKRKYCSDRCAYNHNFKSNARTHNIKCRECGKHKEVSFYRKRFCSDECSKSFGYRMKEVNRRHAIVDNGNVDRDISIGRLIKRDGDQCYICEQPFIRNGDTNHELYPSIEHVIPVAKGGTHTWENVKVAHRKCNWEKGTD